MGQRFAAQLWTDATQTPLKASAALGATLLAINHRHERLIDGLLTLASSEQTLTHTAAVALGDIAGHVAAELQTAARAGGVELRTDLRAAVVTGDPVLLEWLVHNLVDNALRYNVPAHGTVSVTTDMVDGNARLTVENTGPAVPAYEITSLFEPFRRLSSTERLADPTVTRGAGLGLSIVAAVAHAHGGQVHARPRHRGGLTVEVWVPAAGTAPP